MIEQGMGKLNRLSSKALKVITSAEDRHLKRKVLFQQREQAIVAREQALANREEELATRLGALDGREQKLREEVAQRLAADHRKELETKEQAHREVREELAETQKSLRLVIEQAGAAEQQAERERQLADKSTQAMATCEGELKEIGRADV